MKKLLLSLALLTVPMAWAHSAVRSTSANSAMPPRKMVNMQENTATELAAMVQTGKLFTTALTVMNHANEQVKQFAQTVFSLQRFNRAELEQMRLIIKEVKEFLLKNSEECLAVLLGAATAISRHETMENFIASTEGKRLTERKNLLTKELDKEMERLNASLARLRPLEQQDMVMKAFNAFAIALSNIAYAEIVTLPGVLKLRYEKDENKQKILSSVFKKLSTCQADWQPKLVQVVNKIIHEVTTTFDKVLVEEMKRV